ncbi:ImpE family protein [Cupriavidus oxalaticus]|uniref:type VI secretion system accessory protein TagJ n=1 Tax=Cupriavidus oxalaticus TaxID=96344 RepID=UPI003F73C16E
MATDVGASASPGVASLSTMLQQAGSTTGAVGAAESAVRQQPGAFEARWRLFQWLCVMGDWPRALKQLQVATQLAPDFAQTAHVYRDLIRAEVFRKDVFKGTREPGTLTPAPAWVGRLRAALALAEAGDIEGADRSRHMALSDVSVSTGDHDGATFTWITDSDTRLGPTCELISAGRYAWLPFSQLRKLEMGPVAGLLDLIWRPVTATLTDGMVVRGFVPVHYPGSEEGSDAIRLSRETQLTEVGQTGVVACGQKTWMTDAGDIGLLDVTTLTLDDTGNE